MKTSHDTIVEMLQRSVFGLTFEAEGILGYRSQSKVSRALSINLKKQTVEYELTERGLPTRRRVEYSPTLDHLMKKLPLTVGAFDLKFQGWDISENEVPLSALRGSVSIPQREDQWDVNSYRGESKIEEPKKKSLLRLAD